LKLDCIRDNVSVAWFIFSNIIQRSFFSGSISAASGLPKEGGDASKVGQQQPQQADVDAVAARKAERLQRLQTAKLLLLLLQMAKGMWFGSRIWTWALACFLASRLFLFAQ